MGRKNDEGVCSSEQDWEDVRRVCDAIDIPYYSVNFTEEYYDRVFKIFLEAYSKGFTPNPDVLCNKEIKFKAFLDFAIKSGAEKIATGHFVRTNDEGELIQGVDLGKDQSYFLYMLKKSQLKKSLFPVGDLTKTEVRKIAVDAGIPCTIKRTQQAYAL